MFAGSMEEQNEKQTEAVQDARLLARTHEDNNEDARKPPGVPLLRRHSLRIAYRLPYTGVSSSYGVKALNLGRNERVHSLRHFADPNSRHFLQHLHVDCRYHSESRVGNVGRLAIGRECEPIRG